MRKEIFIAVFLGLILGLIVTYGVYTANKAIANNTTTKPHTTTIPTPTPKPPQELQVSIASPEDYTIVDKADVIISGITRTNVVVAILSEDAEYLVESGSDGNFSKTIELVKGSNTIKVQASDGSQLSEQKLLHLVYSTAFSEEEE